MSDDFTIKDSGERQEFSGGMMRDTAEGKAEFRRLLEGPMFKRWAEHLRKGAIKYPDLEGGHANWTLAKGLTEYNRFMDSAFRHFIQWLDGDRDEDHAAAVFFNINGAEYVRDRMNQDVVYTYGGVTEVADVRGKVVTGRDYNYERLMAAFE